MVDTFADKETAELSDLCVAAEKAIADGSVVTSPELVDLIAGARSLMSAVNEARDAYKAEFFRLDGEIRQCKGAISQIKASVQEHRGMLHKIARMKTTGNGRNVDAAMASESFLDQHPE